MTYTSRIPQITLTLEPAVIAALSEGAHLVAEGAKERVEVKTGKLRDAIHVEQERDDFYVVAGDSDVFYGHIVEHGGARVPPRPFLIPALEANTAGVVTTVRAAMRGVVG